MPKHGSEQFVQAPPPGEVGAQFVESIEALLERSRRGAGGGVRRHQELRRRRGDGEARCDNSLWSGLCLTWSCRSVRLGWLRTPVGFRHRRFVRAGPCFGFSRHDGHAKRCLAECDFVSRTQRCAGLKPCAIEPGAVRAAEVLDPVGVALAADARVGTRDEQIRGQVDVGLLRRGDAADGDRGRLAVESLCLTRGTGPLKDERNLIRWHGRCTSGLKRVGLILPPPEKMQALDPWTMIRCTRIGA